MTIEVELTPDEIAQADHFAYLRQQSNRGRRATYGAHRFGDDEQLRIHRIGCRGEAAVLSHFAAALRRRGITPATVWRGHENAEPSTIRGDIAGWEVRTSERSQASLLLHPEDADDSPFVLVTGGLGTTFRLIGWTRARAGKAARYWRTDVRCPAYFVPPRDLDEVPSDPFPVGLLSMHAALERTAV